MEMLIECLNPYTAGDEDDFNGMDPMQEPSSKFDPVNPRLCYVQPPEPVAHAARLVQTVGEEVLFYIIGKGESATNFIDDLHAGMRDVRIPPDEDDAEESVRRGVLECKAAVQLLRVLKDPNVLLVLDVEDPEIMNQFMHGTLREAWVSSKQKLDETPWWNK